jgi:ubiquinone/menaquinone biosynthesis C-methylase UbiE
VPAPRAHQTDVGGREPGQPTPEQFDEMFSRVATSRRLHQLFDEVMGPFPAHVEPSSMVTRAGLDHVFSKCKLGAESHLVDLCCGRGGIGLWFAQRSGARVTGVDFSPEAITQAERRAALFPGVEAAFVVADAASAPLEDRGADVVVCIDSLQLLPEREQVLREVARLLRPSGRAVITTWENDAEKVNGRRPIRDVAPLVESSGLRVLVREEHQEWMERQDELFERAIAEDNDQAEPALRRLAEEGRRVLPFTPTTRRVLVVATVAGS